jgi:hypothetical protein
MTRLATFVLAWILIAPVAAAEEKLESLVDQLVNVTEPGFGYSVYFSGSEFLPYDDSGEFGTLVLGAGHHSRSETMRKIVERGADAVPILVKHIGDDRQIKMQPLTGMDWTSFSDEYDFNRRTSKTAPASINRGGFDHDSPDSHALTVGDLCFVALGQIVNRSFTASRYQPTGGLVINSPTYSKRLRGAIKSDWSTLTRERHKQLLIDDFRRPDYEDRRKGAYLRLAFYYPDAVEPVVLEALGNSALDCSEISEFCRKRLYKPSDAGKRKQLFDDFIRAHGDAWTIGIADQLFDDLEALEDDEQHGSTEYRTERRELVTMTPPLTEFRTQPRELLVQLFGKPPTVKSSERPFIHVKSNLERARLIAALTHDKSKNIGDLVQQILLKNAKDYDLAPACLLCLANRGYGELLVAQLQRIDLAETKTDPLSLKELESISTSKDRVVQDKLLQILKTTSNDEYFMAALAGLDKTDDALVLGLATKILDGLPSETKQGVDMLTMIGKRSPKEAKRNYEAFLAPGSSQRAETMCEVLWYGNPMSKEVLAPLLDDKRNLPNFASPTRVCDRAAQAISNAGGIEFDSDWSISARDKAIATLKEYCRNTGR